jgi:hypothetical protein
VVAGFSMANAPGFCRKSTAFVELTSPLIKAVTMYGNTSNWLLPVSLQGCLAENLSEIKHCRLF